MTHSLLIFIIILTFYLLKKITQHRYYFNDWYNIGTSIVDQFVQSQYFIENS